MDCLLPTDETGDLTISCSFSSGRTLAPRLTSCGGSHDFGDWSFGENWFGSLITRYRGLGERGFIALILSSGSSHGISGLHSFPPNASISFLTAMSHSFISSGLSKTSSRFETARRISARRPPIFLNIDLEISVSTVPSSFKAWEICSTKGLPGIASEAKAADISLNWRIFSGTRSYVPWPAYCSRYPAVTRT